MGLRQDREAVLPVKIFTRWQDLVKIKGVATVKPWATGLIREVFVKGKPHEPSQ